MMARAKIKVGIIGCGAIGTEIALACESRLCGRVELVAVCDADSAKAASLTVRLAKPVPAVTAERLIARAGLVVEAASAKISAGVLEQCIRRKRPCLIMSVGGLLGREDLLARAEEAGVRVFIPSGALCGIDGLKSAAAGSVTSVTLTTKKPLAGLAGAPYIVERRIDLGGIRTETVIFEGTAEEAVKAFPQNVNVAAVLSLAGIGARSTRVRLMTAPSYTRNVHEVEIEGEFGRILTRTENLPSKSNPKTSAMAFYSAIATLDGSTRCVQIGT